MTSSEKWTCISIIEQDTDHYLGICVVEDELIERAAEHGESWDAAWRQFQVDFPRCRVRVDGARPADAGACLRALTNGFAGNRARARAAARLCTQGALARAYAELRAAHPPPRHVLSVPGSCQEHRIDIDTYRGTVRHARVFLVARVTDGGDLQPLETLRVARELGPV